jgi:hypothetical protein
MTVILRTECPFARRDRAPRNYIVGRWKGDVKEYQNSSRTWTLFACDGLLDFRDSYYARSRLLDHVNNDGFDYWSNGLFHFPRSFLHWRALGLRPGNCSLCRFRRLRYLGCLTAFG